MSIKLGKDTVSLYLKEKNPDGVNLGTITVTPTNKETTYTASSEGYDGFSSVTVVGDANHIPENIKKDVVLFGVLGTYEGSSDSSTGTSTNLKKYFASTSSLNDTPSLLEFSITAEDLPGVFDLRKYAFADSRIKSFEANSSLLGVPEHGFYYCENLVKADLSNISPSAVSGSGILGEHAFSHCSALTDVTIGKGINTIASLAFGLCESLTEIKYTGTMAEWNAIEKAGIWRGGSNNLTKVICSDGTVTL